MIQYHKIQSIYKRNPDNKHRTLLMGEFSRQEFKFLQDNQWEFTEKVDGMNIRIMFDGESITFGGKTDRAQLPGDLVNRLNERFLPQLDSFKGIFENSDVCFYGEGYGAGIQKGGNYRLDKDFVLFDISIGSWWLQREDVASLALQFNIDCVPIIRQGTLKEAVVMAQSGFSSRWGNFIAEGIVARPMVELMARNGQRIITKIKHKDFLL